MMEVCSICGLSDPVVWEIWRILLLLTGLFWMAYADLRGRTIPNRLLLFLLLAEALLLILESSADRDQARLMEALEGLFLGGGLCLGCYLLFRGGIGAGDVKLLAVTGFCLGSTEVLPVIVYSVFLDAGVCVILLLLKKADRDTGLPYAPFVFAGVIIVLLVRSREVF